MAISKPPPKLNRWLLANRHLEKSPNCYGESRQEDIRRPVPRPLVFFGPQRNPNDPPRYLYNKDLFFLKNGNTKEKKYIHSLHKIHAERFPEVDLEEKMNRWIRKEFKNFNEDVRLKIQHWKDSWHKIVYKQNQRRFINNLEDYFSKHMITEVVRITNDQPHDLDFIEQIIVMRENDKPDSFSKADFKYLNKNDIEDLKRVHDFQLGFKSYQIKVNLTAPTLKFLGIEAYEPYLIVDKPNTGLIYLNNKYEKRVMYLVEIVKFCDAMLEKVKKFYQNTKSNRKNHEKIIQGLETKVKTLKNEVEGRTNGGKFKECKAIFTEDGSPLYTPFHYSLGEIEYFSANSGFSDNEGQETNKSKNDEMLVTLDIKQVPQEEKQSVSYYVEPYEPPIPFPRRLEHHTEEALVHKPMESLKKIRINRPLLKEIRQIDDYAKHMKNLVANKPKTKEDDKVKMNPRRLDFNKADLGAMISIMPFSMYKRLGLRKLEQINMVIEMVDNTKCTPKGIVKNLLIKIKKFIFPVDFFILEMVEDFRMPIILGRPLLATAHAKVDIFRKSISLEVGNAKVIFKMRRRNSLQDDRGSKGDTFNTLRKIGYIGEALLGKHNDSEQVDLEWEELSFNDWVRIKFGKICKMTKDRILKDHWRERLGDEEDGTDDNEDWRTSRKAGKIRQTQF
ncbi:putative gag-pol polyprotein [Tanacetum coccineum]|uniref:Gag-pol polyprotein n=1 Tax=Tanacetum coccineum TaxID=301880 RepID=A0ABQ5B2R7_9ASTR